MPLWDRHGGPPEVDDDGVLRWRGSWVGLSRNEHRIMTELLGHPGAVVAEDDLVAIGMTPVGARESVRRLRARLEPIGLIVTRIRKRGYSLQPRSGLPPVLEERWFIS